MVSQGLTVLVAVLGFTFLLLGVRRLLRRQGMEVGTSDGVDVDSAETKTVESLGAGELLCHECGARNDADYRFCRYCASELPRVPPTNLATTRSVSRGA